MKHGTYPGGFTKAATTKTDPQLARQFGVHPTTIRNWKNKLGLPLRPGNTIIYEQMDAMLGEGATLSEIMRKTGYSNSAVSSRRRKLYGKKRHPRPKTDDEAKPVEAIVTISRGDRFKLACEAKAELLGMSVDKFMSTWLPTLTGRTWRAYLEV